MSNVALLRAHQEAQAGLADWHEVGDMRAFTALSEAGQAGALNVHPETTRALIVTVEQIFDNGPLVEAARRGELTERHVLAALEVLTPEIDQEVRDRVAKAVIGRYRQRAYDRPGRGWPTPGVFKRALRKELLMHDQQAAKKREQTATDRRGVGMFPLPDGQAQLVIEGPAAMVFGLKDRIDALAQTTGGGPADTRSLDNRRFDCVYGLLTADPAGSPSAIGDLRVRGIEVQLVVPYSTSTSTGGDLELAEIAGYGPVLPCTARELMAPAEYVRRVVVDATTGAVITVDDATRITGDDPADRAAQVAAAVERAGTDPVVRRPLSTEAYRPTLRILRHIRLRDRSLPRLHPTRALDRRRPPQGLATGPDRRLEPAVPVPSPPPSETRQVHDRPRP